MRVIVRVLGGLAVVTLAAALGLAAWGVHAGYRVYVVHTGSMEPTLRPGDAVIDVAPPATVEAGNLITFRASGPDALVTHRVVSYVDGIVQTRGDANDSIDPWALPMRNVIGSVALVLPRAGYLLVYVRSPQGLGSLVTALLALALLWQIFFPPPTLRGGTDRARHLRPSRGQATAATSKPSIPSPPVCSLGDVVTATAQIEVAPATRRDEPTGVPLRRPPGPA